MNDYPNAFEATLDELVRAKILIPKKTMKASHLSADAGPMVSPEGPLSTVYEFSVSPLYRLYVEREPERFDEVELIWIGKFDWVEFRTPTRGGVTTQFFLRLPKDAALRVQVIQETVLTGLGQLLDIDAAIDGLQKLYD